jgi:hypothetical protein
MQAAPHSHTPNSTAPALRFREISMPTSSRPPSCVAHTTRDAPNPLKKPPSGTRKLTEVATQIQYFAVAAPLQMEVKIHAARHTSEAKRRCTSR